MIKIPVYFMPGLAASPSIFEFINLPNDIFEIHYLDWIPPLAKETLTSYAKRMAELIQKEYPVLIGVSFGGILVQEMAQYLTVRKLIIISSVKSMFELPPSMLLAKKTKVYKLIPTGVFQNLEFLSKYALGTMVKKRLKLYEKYLTHDDKEYLDWSIEQVICWDRTAIDPNVVHIHGQNDTVFPVQYISNYLPVKGGTHIMIINRFKWFNEHLPKIILEK